jgi:putative membrane protein|tara:strand:- start:994 stop:1467 length:474 start_codon:yes stop_codon:yes gene_type:complete
MSEPPPKQPVRDFLHQFVVGAFAVLIAVNVVPGIKYDTTMDLLLASLVLGALNAFLRPFLLLGCLPLLILTLGLFLMVINAMLLLLTAELVEGFNITGGFWTAFWGALVISIVTLIANSLTKRGGSRMSFRRVKAKDTQSNRQTSRHDDDDGPVIDV